MFSPSHVPRFPLPGRRFPLLVWPDRCPHAVQVAGAPPRWPCGVRRCPGRAGGLGSLAARLRSRLRDVCDHPATISGGRVS